MIKAHLVTPVEIYRDGTKILDTKANVQKGQILFDDVDVKELDIVKVIPTKKEFRIVDLHKQLRAFGNKVEFVEAKVEKC